MLRGTRLVALTATLSTALLLTACTAEAPAETIASSLPVVSAPAFSSKAAAFTAAEKVYRRYLTKIQLLDAEPDQADLSVLQGVATERARSEVAATLEQAARRRLRVVGPQKLFAFRGQSADSQSGTASAYVCLNLRKARVLDGENKDVTPNSRGNYSSVIAYFVPKKGSMLFDHENPYSGRGAC